MSASTSRVAAVVRLELATQRREPMTVLYALVLGLLAFAFASAGPVELVRQRGTVPRDAAWSLMLASTALTAFGQVITTMVAATVVLRDRADRVHELLQVTPLTEREYRSGNLLAALVMLSVIYAAIPLGLTAGAMVAGGQWLPALRGSLLPFAVVVLPTMLAVGALQFGIGALSGRLWMIVGQGLLLIWLWSGVTAAAIGAPASLLLLDPFGSAPLLAATSTWTDAQRSLDPMPITLPLLAGRVFWLVLGAAVAAAAIVGRPRRARTPEAAVPSAPIAWRALEPSRVMRAQQQTPGWRGALATSRYVARWMLRDPGWQVLAVLGMLNVGIHAALDASAARSRAQLTETVITGLALHARLFLILLATIYAGELVWREAEDRSAGLFDSMPIGDGARMAGRVAGVVAAQCVLVIALVLAASCGGLIGNPVGIDAGTIVRRASGEILSPFIGWMAVSLLVHVVVRHKVAAHLLCIAGWVLAVVWLGAAEPRAEAAQWFWPLATMLALVVVRAVWHRDGVGKRRRVLSRPVG